MLRLSQQLPEFDTDVYKRQGVGHAASSLKFLCVIFLLGFLLEKFLRAQGETLVRSGKEDVYKRQVLNTGKTEQELETNVFQAVSIAQKHNCELCRLDFQQEQGLMSSLPLADCQIEIQRGLTTSSTAIFVPFTTQELFDNGKESLYYGLNALSNNLIMRCV